MLTSKVFLISSKMICESDGELSRYGSWFKSWPARTMIGYARKFRMWLLDFIANWPARYYWCSSDAVLPVRSPVYAPSSPTRVFYLLHASDGFEHFLSIEAYPC